MKKKEYTIYNPNNLPIKDLPVIYGFNNGGSPGLLSGILLAEDGICLGTHICSDEMIMLKDLGILDGSSPARHNEFKHYYPNGYSMDFVSIDDIDTHKGLQGAYKKNKVL